MTVKTERLIIRPFINSDSLFSIHRILNPAEAGSDRADLKDARSWLEWQVLNHEWFGRMRQPPYGDRAVTLKKGGEMIGAVGYVPCLAPFEQIPELRSGPQLSRYYSTEFGLFYAITPEFRGQGYATEAARGMLEHAFKQLHVKRVITMTDYANLASQNVMRKLGMKVARNPLPEPRWLQVVGVSENHED